MPTWTAPNHSGEASTLADLLKLGKIRVLEDILMEYGPRVRGTVRKRYRLSAEDAEDVVVEALCKLWVSRDRYDPARGTLEQWFRRICNNTALNLLSDSNVRRPNISAGKPEVPGDRTTLENQEEPRTPAQDKKDLQEALNELSAEELQIINAWADAKGETWTDNLTAESKERASLRTKLSRTLNRIRKAIKRIRKEREM